MRTVQIDPSQHQIFVGADFQHWIGSGSSAGAAEIFITAFGERIARKRISAPALRTASAGRIRLDPDWLGGIGLLAAATVLAWAARRGALVLVIRRPGHAAVATLAAASLVITPKVWAGGGGAPEIYWEIADPLGSGLLLVDEAGERAEETHYTPYGEVRVSAGPLGQGTLSHMYAGHRYDGSSGLVYMNARWYEPGAGRFMSVDPVVALKDDPQSQNPYSYARGNPILYDDPSGMCWTTLQCGRVDYGVAVPESEVVTKDGEKVLETTWHEYGNGVKLGTTTTETTLTQKSITAPGAGAQGGGGSETGDASQSGVSELAPPIEGVDRGMGPKTREFIAKSGSDVLAGAASKLGEAADQFGKYDSIGTANIPGSGLTEPSRGTAETGRVRGPTGVTAVRSAASAGANAIIIRLPANANNAASSRGAFVPSALGISAANGGIPVFLHAPRGAFGSMLAVEFTGSRGSPAGLIAPVRFR